MSSYNIEQMDSFQRGVSRMNAELLQIIADQRAEQALEDVQLLAERLGMPPEPRIQEILDEEVKFVERKRRGRPRKPDFLTELKVDLVTFKTTSLVGQEKVLNVRGQTTTLEKVRGIVNIIFDILIPIANERFAILLNDGTYYAITSRTSSRLENMLTGMTRVVEAVGSDEELYYSLSRAEYINIVRLPDYDPTARQRRSGAFFKYLNNTKLDLTRQGIFSKKDERMNEVCLITSLVNGGLEEKKIDSLKHLVKTNKISVCRLEEICQHIDICIELKQLRINQTRDKNYVKVYGNRANKTFKIGLIDEHYFLIEPVAITSYALINHYDDVSKFSVIDSKGKRKKDRYIDSYRAIEILHQYKETHLKELKVNDLMETPHYDSVDSYSSLDYSDKNVKLIEGNKLGKPKDYEQIIYLDFETDTSDGLHKPYLCHYVIDGDEKKINRFVGGQCAFDFLKSLTCDTLIYAHNAGYDFKFITPYLMNMKPIMRGSGLICCTAKFHNIVLDKYVNLYIKDSYKLISSPLSKFGKMFSLDQEKELLPYSIYTTKNIKDRFVSLDKLKECRELENKTDYDRFLSNCNKWNVLIQDKVDIIEYSSVYCRYDCIVLCKGLNKFRDWMLEVSKIDIHNCVSIPSLVHQYFIDNDVYQGVYEISGIPRHFIQKCVIGGRCMTSENKKIRKEECILNDFDAVSLYPSAMKRLGEIGGFLKGVPKVLTDKTYVFLSKQDGYFVKILIKSVGKKYKFPLMTYKNDQGIRQFTNDMEGKTLFVDKIYLEDLIKYHKIQFDVLEGYYFDEGRNDTILRIIQYLFSERLRKKKEGNPIQEVYKLIMNSSYGKTLLKPIETDKIIIDGEDKMKKYLSTYYDNIKQVVPLAYNNSKYAVETIKSINNHYNVCHIGVEILSMSKRIMNEVMCLAEDNQLSIYYQDTDSMHIDDVDIKKLQNEFMRSFGRELIGKGMGQFHSDFDLEGCKDVIAVKSIFLGKKSYLDVLRGVDIKTGETKNGYHIRLKGIPNTAIWYKVDNEYNGDAYQLYLDLYNGKKVKFDLLEGGRRCRFSGGKNLGVSTISEFTREVRF